MENGDLIGVLINYLHYLQRPITKSNYITRNCVYNLIFIDSQLPTKLVRCVKVKRKLLNSGIKLIFYT